MKYHPAVCDYQMTVDNAAYALSNWTYTSNTSASANRALYPTASWLNITPPEPTLTVEFRLAGNPNAEKMQQAIQRLAAGYLPDEYYPGDLMELERGHPHHLKLPDGSSLYVDRDGNWHVDDSAQQVVYKANTVREFNPYVSCSDIMEQFIGLCGKLGLKRQQLLQLPVELFIRFLILEAAKKDGEIPPTAPLEQHPALQAGRALRARCGRCGRFVRKQSAALGILFCGPQHLAEYAQRHNLALAA